jgi:hypothetical protein
MQILRSDSISRCQLSTLEIVVSQENFTYCVSEIDLFNACVKWAKKFDQPRQALGSVLRHIRFRTFTYQEFETHVLPSNLLTNTEGLKIALCITSSKCKMPRGFSNEIRPRFNMEKLIEREEDIYFDIKGDGTYMTPADIAVRPVRISTSRSVWMLGVRLQAYREDKRNIEEHHQTVEVLLRQRDTILLATATYSRPVRGGHFYDVRFEQPFLLAANTEYQIQVVYPLSDARHGCFERYQQTRKTESGVEVRLLENVWTPMYLRLILSDYEC